MKRHVVLLLGPSREAISGVTTHLNGLLGSRLASRFELVHFQVGSEGRNEGLLGRLARLVQSPLALAGAIARHGAELVHINTSLNAKAYWRDFSYVLAARLCGARVLYQVHGGLLDEFAGKSRVFAAFMRRMLHWPDVVVVLSHEQLGAFRAAAPAQAVELVPNGIDCAPYLRYNRALPEPGAPLRLIYVGRLVPGKGLLETVAFRKQRWEHYRTLDVPSAWQGVPEPETVGTRHRCDAPDASDEGFRVPSPGG